jgi:hypothetical protein
MRIVHINTLDYEGGAAKAAWRLHEGLQLRGHESRLLVKMKYTAEKRVACIHESSAAKAIDRLTATVMDRFSLQDLWYPVAGRLPRHPWVKGADVVQLHNLHGQYFPFPKLVQLSHQKPVVWLLHDMWALSGHCSFNFGCERWRSGCGNCPILHEDYLPLRRDTTGLHWRLKQRTYARSHLHIVAPSRWLVNQAKNSPLLARFPIHHIPYGLNTEIHKPLHQAAALHILDLPKDARVILFAAHVLDDSPRKGATHFRRMLERLKTEVPEMAAKLQVLMIGFGPVGDSEVAGIRAGRWAILGAHACSPRSTRRPICWSCQRWPIICR